MCGNKINRAGTKKYGLADAFGDLNHKIDWATPPTVFKYFKEKYHINPQIDCAATAINTKCEQFITKEMNLFKQQITRAAYLNPPYLKSNKNKGIKGVDQFVIYVYKQHVLHNIELSVLVPSTVSSTPWYAKYVGEEDINFFGETVEVKKPPFRIQFIDDEGRKDKSPPFSSNLFIWRPKPLDIISKIRLNLFGDGGLDKYTSDQFLE